METEGPPLEQLVRRIAETPDDFLAPPKIGSGGTVSVPAVVYDLAASLHVTLSDQDLARFVGQNRDKDAARLGITLLLCWAISGDGLSGRTINAESLMDLLDETAGQLGAQATPLKYVQDPDRREELARLSMAAFGCRPAGETKAQAQDRLTSISGVERNRVLKAARAAEQRARAIREALARKAAEESADKWTRE
jgi:hypothetical protein